MWYAFHVHRAAVLLVLYPDGSVQATPFVNLHTDNRTSWGADVRLRFAGCSDDAAPADLTVSQYYLAKAARLGLRQSEADLPEFVREQQGWWLNGHLLCNVRASTAREPWSLRGVDALVAMVSQSWPLSAAKRRPQRAHHLVLNKRDAPLLRSDGASTPFPCLLARIDACMPPLWVRPMLPPLSPYTGPLWADAAFPLAEAWEWLNEATPRPESAAAVMQRLLRGGCPPRVLLQGWHSRSPVAVFRGTATGPHACRARNQRLRLVDLSLQRPGMLDARITAWNARDRLHGGVVTHGSRHADLEGAPLSPGAQASGYRYLVYACGHQAASRLVWNLASGCTVIVLDPPEGVVAPHTWLHAALRPGVNCLSALADLSDLPQVIARLKQDDSLAQRLALAAMDTAFKWLREEALLQASASAVERCLDGATHPHEQRGTH